MGGLILTVERLGWKWIEPHLMQDDRGTVWDCRLDSPAALKKAVAASVRRWRFARIAADLPGLIPEHTDVGHGAHESTIVVDIAAPVVTSLTKGKPKALKELESWNGGCRAALASAMSGGQWSQARKAQVPAWKILDNTCQLCKQEVGTIEHRFACSATMPPGDWPPPPKGAEHALSRISERRRKILQLNGVLALKLPKPSNSPEGWFEWLSPPPDVTRKDLLFFTDGSALDSGLKDVVSLGFAIVVAAKNGELVAWGYGAPPHHITDSGLAEAWALQQVLTMVPETLQIFTDCFGLRKTAEAGLAAATTAASPAARIWNMIGNVLDGDLTSLAASDGLQWIPAHLSFHAIGKQHVHGRSELTSLQWRSNRLVDALAQAA